MRVFERPAVFRLFAMAAVPMLLATACSSDDDPDSASESTTTETGTDVAPAADCGTDPIKIGLMTSLSGNLAAIGNANADGTAAAAEYINANGGIDGRQVELVIADDQNDPATASTEARRLIQEDILAFIGPTASVPSGAVVPLITPLNIPNMLTSIIPTQLEGENSPNTFAFTFAPASESEAVYEFAKGEGYERIGLIYAENPTGDAWLAGLEEVAGDDLVIAEGADPLATDFTAVVSRVVAEDPDILIMIMGGTQAGVLLKAIGESGYEGQPFSYQGLLSLPYSAVEDIAGPEILSRTLASGAAPQVYDSLPADDPRTDEIQLFLDEFEKLHGAAPELPGFSSTSWDALMVLARAAEKTPGATCSGEEWVDAVEKLENETLAAARYTFTPDDQIGPESSDMVIIKVEDGKYVALDG